jgi:alkanesulfonate monooxygenase SsuD/methylene tetrahydromethanopterin reductase-like flavin-dependent oxidoreductase (luciferase family)
VHLLTSLSAHGWHPAAWRVSGAAGFEGVTPFKAMARLAERGGLDAVLLGLPSGSAGGDTLHLDPLPLLGALIGATQRIGLCSYWPCDIAEPYHVARVFATLDHLANGRTGWIAGLAGQEALAGKFQRLDLPSAPADAAARMVELIDVARQLWDSWEDEGFVVDQATGAFANPEKVHPIDHAGRFFTVRGPLNVPRPVQGQPVILYRDGVPDEARAGIAASAEVIIAECPTLADAQARRQQWRALAMKQGRAPDSLRFIVRVMPILADTDEAAEKRAAELDGLAPTPDFLRFVGTPDLFALLMAEWQAEQACDGFDILPAVGAIDLAQVVEGVIPELRRVGLRPTGCRGDTLRAELGLQRAASRFAA